MSIKNKNIYFFRYKIMSDLTDRKTKWLEHDKRIWDSNGKLWVRQIEVVKLSKY